LRVLKPEPKHICEYCDQEYKKEQDAVICEEKCKIESKKAIKEVSKLKERIKKLEQKQSNPIFVPYQVPYYEPLSQLLVPYYYYTWCSTNCDNDVSTIGTFSEDSTGVLSITNSSKY
jgi:hypothetical protein